MATNGLLDLLLKIPVLNILILLMAVLSLEIVGDRYMRFMVNHVKIAKHLEKKGPAFPSHLSEATRDS